MLERIWRKGNTFALLVGMQIGGATVESSVEIPQKLKNGFAFWPGDPTSGTISEGTKNTNLREHKYLYVHCSIIDNCQDMEAAQVSTSRWVDKTTMGHWHNGILLSHKKEENFSPGWCDSVVECQPADQGVASLTPSLEHMPEFRARYPVGGAQQATTHWCFCPSLSPSFPSLKNK